MVALAPLAIFLGAAISAALAFFAFWDGIHRGAMAKVTGFAAMLDRAGIRRKPEEIIITWVTITAVLWIGSSWLLQASPVLGMFLLVLAAACSALALAAGLQFQLKRRTAAFLDQFETTLRLMSSGLRSGLGLQQALTMVVEESAEPARHEFSRVLGQSNIGVSVYDALDDLAMRMPTNETLMMARVVRINAQAGGDLGHVLEQLANTIRERRRMRRKVQSITAEGRAGAMVLGAMPMFLGAFILMTQPRMNHGLLWTAPGHVVLVIIALLETLGILTLMRLLKVNVR